jgi:hypothetical protein
MHGPLSEIGLIEVLQLLDRGSRSGVLRITGASPAESSELRIANGRVVALEPQASDSRIREVLAVRHLVSDAEAADDPGVLQRPVAAPVRAELAAQALAAMVQYRSGRFDFASSSVGDGPLNLSPDRLVFDLVGSESRRVELAEQLGEFRAVPMFTGMSHAGENNMPTFTPRDWRVLDLVDGTRDIAAIAAALDEPLEDVAASVQSLHAALILEVRQPPPSKAHAARAAFEAGDYDVAAELLRSRVTEHPEDGDSWRSLGLAEVGAGRFESAIAAWQSWSAGNPDRAVEATALMQAARTMVEALRDARD